MEGRMVNGDNVSSSQENHHPKRTSYRCLFTSVGEVESNGVTIRTCCTMAGPPDIRGQTLIQVAVKKSRCLSKICGSCKKQFGKAVLKRNFGKVYYLNDESVMPPRTLSKRNPPQSMDPSLGKYWRQRQKLFTRFDQGIILDKEMWYSVTPEMYARHHAERLKSKSAMDGFSGAGGDIVQFARTCNHVIAMEISHDRLEMARHNAQIYGVEDKITFIHGDYFKEAQKYKVDVVFMSPPWGGPDYNKSQNYKVKNLPYDFQKLLDIAFKIAPGVGIFLPRNIEIGDLILYVPAGQSLGLDYHLLPDGKIKAMTAYFGNAAVYVPEKEGSSYVAIEVENQSQIQMEVTKRLKAKKEGNKSSSSCSEGSN